MGGHLSHFTSNWKSFGADPCVVATLEQGYKWEFLEQPRLATQPLILSTARSRVVEDGMDQQLAKLLADSAIERVRHCSSPGFYSWWFVIPKKQSGHWRAILDLFRFNHYVRKESLKRETSEVVRQHLRQGEWVTLLDITDAYKDLVYQYCSLPKGLTTACQASIRSSRG